MVDKFFIPVIVVYGSPTDNQSFRFGYIPEMEFYKTYLEKIPLNKGLGAVIYGLATLGYRLTIVDTETINNEIVVLHVFYPGE